jgi:hypothetical protein
MNCQKLTATRRTTTQKRRRGDELALRDGPMVVKRQQAALSQSDFNVFQWDGVEATTGIEPVYTVLQTVA